MKWRKQFDEGTEENKTINTVLTGSTSIFRRCSFNGPGQTIAAFERNISQHCWAQHVERVWPPCWEVLRRVATCWVLLAQIWNWSNFSCNICGCCMMLQSFGQVRATMLRLSMRNSSIFNSQHVATGPNRVAKRVQHVVICCVQMFRSFGRSCKCWGNNVGICCVKMFRSFGRGLILKCVAFRWREVYYSNQRLFPFWNDVKKSKLEWNFESFTHYFFSFPVNIALFPSL